jgi:adenylate cyclase
MKRRMAAILVADVVGFSAMMEADEEGTALLLEGSRAALDAEIAKSHGRIFKAMGDALLVEFASPINAVSCATAIRNELARAEGRVRMRFGLHFADVLVQGDDLLGDGVNLAARIQQAAEPDAIDVSATLFDNIRRNSPFAFESLAARSFKNIAEPIEVYRLRGDIGRHRYQIAPTKAAPSKTKRPQSLAVMTIETTTGNEDQRYLAEGITEELTFELARFRHLFVSSRSATRVLEGTNTEVKSVGDRLGVRYVLSGAVRQLGSQVRLSVTLSETETGGVVWTDRPSMPFNDLVDLDGLVSKIASTVLGQIEQSDIAAARRAKPESMTAYELHLRGLEHHRLGGVTDENLRQAMMGLNARSRQTPTLLVPKPCGCARDLGCRTSIGMTFKIGRSARWNSTRTIPRQTALWGRFYLTGALTTQRGLISRRRNY